MIKSLSRVAIVRVAPLLASLAAIGGCSLNTDTKAYALQSYSGDGQSAPPNTMLQDPLVVVVVNPHGDRLPGVQVSWAIATGGGSLSAPTSVSDETGRASIQYTTGPTPGQAVVNAGARWVAPISFVLMIQ